MKSREVIVGIGILRVICWRLEFFKIYLVCTCGNTHQLEKWFLCRSFMIGPSFVLISFSSHFYRSIASFFLLHNYQLERCFSFALVVFLSSQDSQDNMYRKSLCRHLNFERCNRCCSRGLCKFDPKYQDLERQCNRCDWMNKTDSAAGNGNLAGIHELETPRRFHCWNEISKIR